MPVFRRPSRKPERRKPIGEPDGGRLADAAGGDALLAEVDHALQERAGREDDGAGAVSVAPVAQSSTPATRPILDDQVLDRRLDDLAGSGVAASAACMASR